MASCWPTSSSYILEREFWWGKVRSKTGLRQQQTKGNCSVCETEYWGSLQTEWCWPQSFAEFVCLTFVQLSLDSNLGGRNFKKTHNTLRGFNVLFFWCSKTTSRYELMEGDMCSLKPPSLSEVHWRTAFINLTGPKTSSCFCRNSGIWTKEIRTLWLFGPNSLFSFHCLLWLSETLHCFQEDNPVLGNSVNQFYHFYLFQQHCVRSA